jgi:hypothetical protein
MQLVEAWHDGVMVERIALYSTVAQVLPTLVISLVIEAHLLAGPQREAAKTMYRRIEQLAASRQPAVYKELEDLSRQHDGLINKLEGGKLITALLALVFLAGEFMSVSALNWGEAAHPVKDIHLGDFAGPVALGSVAVLSMAIVILPLMRYPRVSDLRTPPGYKPDTEVPFPTAADA